jgi:glyoxylase-like metal-dependent hydrolase (beta-lactamase superfamily II)
MSQSAKTYRIGDVTIVKVHEQYLRNVPPSFLFPTAPPKDFEVIAQSLDRSDLEDDRQNLVLSIHTWLVRTPHHVILLDTGAGNDKERPRNPFFHRLNGPYLANLAAAGVRPEDVDFVFNTHLHVDHVGWSTTLHDGKWRPTFPKAKYVFPRAEEEYYSSPASHNEVNIPSLGVFEDSVLPIIEAGLAERIGPQGETYLDNFEFVPTKGHSIGHMSIRLASKGQEAIFGGDVMHHPVQVQRPEWNTVFCEFGEEALRARRQVLEEVAVKRTLYFATHFPGSSVGYVEREAMRLSWTYA